MKPISFLVLLALLFGCKKNNNTDSSSSIDDVQEIVETSFIDKIDDDLLKLVEDQYQVELGSIVRNRNNYTSIKPNCLNKNKTDLGGGKSKIILESSTVLGCLFGKSYIKGKLSMEGKFSGNDKDTVVITFDDFRHGTNLITGTKTIIFSNESTSNLNTLHRVVRISFDWTVEKFNGNKFRHEGNRVREIVEGQDTPELTDNKYLISGKWKFTNHKNSLREVEILEPLHLSLSCENIVKGKISYKRNNYEVTLDYGDGACDDKASITVGGQTTNITLLSL